METYRLKATYDPLTSKSPEWKFERIDEGKSNTTLADNITASLIEKGLRDFWGKIQPKTLDVRLEI